MRATRKKAKPGEVLFFFGRLAGEDTADMVGMWGGEGATKRHSNAVMYGFTGHRLEDDQTRHTGWKFGNSFLADLEAAGFDTTTIEFSIRIKTPNAPHEGPARASCAGPLDAVVGGEGENDGNV